MIARRGRLAAAGLRLPIGRFGLARESRRLRVPRDRSAQQPRIRGVVKRSTGPRWRPETLRTLGVSARASATSRARRSPPRPARPDWPRGTSADHMQRGLRSGSTWSRSASSCPPGLPSAPGTDGTGGGSVCRAPVIDPSWFALPACRLPARARRPVRRGSKRAEAAPSRIWVAACSASATDANGPDCASVVPTAGNDLPAVLTAVALNDEELARSLVNACYASTRRAGLLCCGGHVPTASLLF